MNKKLRLFITVVGSFLVLFLLNVLYSMISTFGPEPAAGIVKHFYFLLPLAMVTAWGISSVRRMINSKIRMNFFAIAISILVWIILREIKWRFAFHVMIERNIWYSYYIPMILMPLFGFNAAREVGMRDSIKDSKGWIALYTCATALIVFVLTNDIHGQVFHLTDPTSIQNYTYQWGYYLVAAWIVLVDVAMIVLLEQGSNHRLKGWRRFAPLFAIAIGGVYGVIYGIRKTAFVDLTSMFCWLTVMTWEICSYAGLIPTNTNYMDFFMASNLRAQIVDPQGNTLISAQNAAVLSPGLFHDLQIHGVRYYNPNTQLHMFPISCGYVIWQEDVSRMRAMLDELAQYHQELQEGNTLAEEEMKASVRREQINEKNRLYTILSSEMDGSLRHMKNLTQALQVAQTEEEAHKILSQINILGVYLKRRSNFLMLLETSPEIPIQELELCLMEIERNLIVCNVRFTYEILTERNLTKQEIFAAYDQLEPFIERTMFLTNHIHVEFEGENLVTMTISAEGQETVIFSLGKGGDVK